jgi:hypothetical protein
MNAEDFAKKQPMAVPGFTVLAPKQETEYDKMILEKQMEGCVGCGDERPAYPVPILPSQDVPTETGKKNSKR